MKKSRYEEEWKDFKVWARWAQRSDRNTIMRICGLTIDGSIPTLMMEVADSWHKEDEDAPLIYEQTTPKEPSLALVVQEFMELLQATSPNIHKALVARHLKRVMGELMLFSSERGIAARLYAQAPALAHVRLIKDCDKGYEAYSLWLKVQKVAA